MHLRRDPLRSYINPIALLTVHAQPVTNTSKSSLVPSLLNSKNCNNVTNTNHLVHSVSSPHFQSIALLNDVCSATPNGYKISILLEELGLKYDVKSLSFQKNEQKVFQTLKLGLMENRKIGS